MINQIAAEEKPSEFPVARMCTWAGVSESGFYAWRRRTPSPSARRREWLAGEVSRVFAASNGVFGYRKVHAQLADEGIVVCDRLVRDLMAEQGLESCHPAPWRHLTQPDGTPPAPDLIARDFTATRPGVRLVGDITQIDTWEGPLFLATVIDLYNREVVGWAMAEHHRAELVCKAIEMARRNRRSDGGRSFTPTAAPNTPHERSGTASARTGGSAHRWAKSAARSTTPWPNRSSQR